MAHPDFMRFSLGVYTREQTAGFIEKLLAWERAGLPSQFALITRSGGALIGYCGFYHHPGEGIDDVEIGYRVDSAYWTVGSPQKLPGPCAITVFVI